MISKRIIILTGPQRKYSSKFCDGSLKYFLEQAVELWAPGDTTYKEIKKYII